MSDKYILIGKIPVPIEDCIEWARWFELQDRRVAQDCIGDMRVSTVFLGLDHNFGFGPPMLFETMIFGGDLDCTEYRTSTWDEAEAMHKTTVERIRALK